MQASPLQDALQAPISSLTILLCTLWYLYTWNYSFDLSRVSYCYSTTFLNKQYWRALTSSYSHASFMHVGFNMVSLSSFSSAEAQLGSLFYLKITFILLFGSILAITGVSHLLIHQLNQPRYKDQAAVGYSCVVFGWMAFLSSADPLRMVSMFGLIRMPALVSPFASLLFTQLIVPRASFIGHFCGIAIGFGIGFGAFSWLLASDYLFACVGFWVFVALVWSIRFHSRVGELGLPCIAPAESGETSPTSYQIVDGVLQAT